MRREIADGHVVCEAGRIAAVGEGAAPAVADGARRIDGRGKLATPGLVNCHHHLYQHATRGYAQQATLFEWLVALYPVCAHIDDDVVDAAARAGLAALARCWPATATTSRSPTRRCAASAAASCCRSATRRSTST
jgi:cytosine/adenosine deaminase-related metal-dependent hydrolase